MRENGRLSLVDTYIYTILFHKTHTQTHTLQSVSALFSKTTTIVRIVDNERIIRLIVLLFSFRPFDGQ